MYEGVVDIETAGAVVCPICEQIAPSQADVVSIKNNGACIVCHDWLVERSGEADAETLEDEHDPIDICGYYDERRPV